MRPMFSTGMGALLLLATSGCINVIHVECDAGTNVVVVQPKTLHAQLLVALNLNRAAANLVGPYSGIVERLVLGLAASGVVVDETGVLPIYGGVNGMPALVYGTPSKGGGDLSSLLADVVSSGNFDKPLSGSTAEQANLASLVGRLDLATLPPELTDGSSTPFFSAPKDVFIIVTIQPIHRICADTDPACAIGGLDPVSFFSAAAQDGTASWLRLPGGSYPKGHVYQVFIATAEGETPMTFGTRCGGVAGFPKALLDVMEPSSLKYYTDVAAGLSAKGMNVSQIDLCNALGADSAKISLDLAAKIVQSALR